jgi:ribose 5-phosphate isomerase B
MNNDQQGKILGISCDHAGFDLKQVLMEYLRKEGIEVQDFGPQTADRVDYPDMIHPLAHAVDKGQLSTGIIICGSGNGVAMTANKYPKVRAALCWNREIAELARQHNDANIISLPARFITEQVAKECVDVFLKTSFEGGRHAARVEKIAIR